MKQLTSPHLCSRTALRQLTVSEGQIWLKGTGSSTIINGDGTLCGTIIATGRAIIGLQDMILNGSASTSGCQSTLFAQEFGFMHAEESGQIEI